jgi:Na+-driven multidrug efflux pump
VESDMLLLDTFGPVTTCDGSLISVIVVFGNRLSADDLPRVKTAFHLYLLPLSYFACCTMFTLLELDTFILHTFFKPGVLGPTVIEV